MSHSRFNSGKLSTKFLAEEYPQGFERGSFSTDELEELGIAAVFSHLQRELYQFSSRNEETLNQAVLKQLWVVVDQKEYEVETTIDHETKDYFMMVNGKQVHVHGAWEIDAPSMDLVVDGRSIRIQYMKRNLLGCRLQYHGTLFDILVLTATQKKLSKYMRSKPKVDTSRWVMAPMPGTVISIAVTSGDLVKPISIIYGLCFNLTHVIFTLIGYSGTGNCCSRGHEDAKHIKSTTCRKSKIHSCKSRNQCEC
jgi:propionyl-CoA carboxylase alpha chain